MTTTAARLRGLLAALLLLALVAGLPLLLWLVAGSPLPTSLPTWNQITDTFTQPDYTGEFLLGVIKAVAWLAWATFAAAMITETFAQLRGVRAPRLRGLGIQQRLAAGLVASVLVALSLAPLISAAPASAATVSTSGPSLTPTVTISAPATPAPAAVADVQDAAPASDELATYQVRKGDSLWAIAAAQLGDGQRWQEIAELNYGRPQPGGYSLGSSHWIDPGWTLVLPTPAATPDAPAPAPAPAHDETHVVEAGESLWSIADDELGEGQRWPEIYDASRDIDQGDGVHLQDPGLIRPGWTVVVPGASTTQEADTPAPAAEQPPAPDQAPAAANPPTDPAPDTAPATDAGVAPAAEAPAAEAPAAEAPAAGPTAQDSEQQTDQSRTAAQDADDIDESVDVRTVAGVGGLLAVGILGLLTVKRAAARRRRRPGERIALPEPDSGESVLEAELRAVADPLGVDTVNRALRSMAAWHREQGKALPDVRAARLSEEFFEIYLDQPAELPAPWTGTADRCIWQITASDTAEIPLEVDADTSSPYPSLVTLGHDEENAHVLLDLEQVDCLSIRGDEATTHATLAALAIELATTPWADDVQVTLVSTMPELGDVVDTGRIRHVHGLANIVRELEARAGDVDAALEQAGADSLVDARGRGLAADAWTPEILLIGEQLDPAVRAALEKLVSRIPRVGIAAVTSDEQMGEWVLDLDLNDPSRGILQPAGITIRPQQLDAATYELALNLLREQEPQPGPTWASHLVDDEVPLADLPIADVDEVQADETLVDEEEPTIPAAVIQLRPPAVKVLGNVEIDVTSGVTMQPSHLRQVTELVTFLALHPGATGAGISAAMWPGRAPNLQTRRSAVSRARRWLGVDADGRHHLPLFVGSQEDAADGEGYRLRGVTTDWEQFLALVSDNAATAPLADLKAALSLVRGRPFADARSTRYVWAEPDMQEMLAAIVDVAHEVARRALQTGDTATARQAAATGRLVDAADERVWRDGIRAEWVAGRTEDATRLVDQLQNLLADLDTEAEPETEELFAEVQKLTDRRAAHGGAR
jgi:nucleoid-associated protein YgaU/DNA-binding SARP family transcriptional activator